MKPNQVKILSQKHYTKSFKSFGPFYHAAMSNYPTNFLTPTDEYDAIFGALNPNNHDHQVLDDYNYFDVSDYMAMADHENDQNSTSGFNACLSQSDPLAQEMTSSGSTSSSFNNGVTENNNGTKFKRQMKRADHQVDDGRVFVFRTKTELETLDDGYRWRKYGKKTVKSNPNPRNYYKCMSPGCTVKKRVERDGENPSILLTSYEGVHNHECPSIVHYSYIPSSSTPPSQWSLQASHFNTNG